MSKWDSLLERNWHPSLEKCRLDYLQSLFATFSVTQIAESFTQTMLSLESKKQYYPNITYQVQIQVIMRCVSIYLESGYVEFASGLFQSFLEWNFFPVKEQTREIRLHRFRRFWDSSMPKVGDRGAIGWNNSDQDVCKSKTLNEYNISSSFCCELFDAPIETDCWSSKEFQKSFHNVKPFTLISKDDFESSENPKILTTDPFKFVLFDDVRLSLVDINSDDTSIHIISAFFKIFGVNLLASTCSTKLHNSLEKTRESTEKLIENSIYDDDQLLDSYGGVWWNHNQMHFGSLKLPLHSQYLISKPETIENFSDIDLESRLLPKTPHLRLGATNCPILPSFIGFKQNYKKNGENTDSNVVPYVAYWINNNILSNNIQTPFLPFASNALEQLLNSRIKEWASISYLLVESSISHKRGKDASKKVLSSMPESWLLWNIYAQIELFYGFTEKAIKVWNGALKRLALKPVAQQSVAVVIWLSIIMHFISVTNIESAKCKSLLSFQVSITNGCLVIMHYPELWEKISEAKLDLSGLENRISDLNGRMSNKYAKWNSKYDPSEWFSGLVLYSLHVYFFPRSNNSQFDDYDLLGAEQVLTASIKDLEIMTEHDPCDIDLTYDMAQRYKLEELITEQIASLNYYHNYSSGRDVRSYKQQLTYNSKSGNEAKVPLTKLLRVIDEAIRHVPWSKGILSLATRLHESGIQEIKKEELFKIMQEKELRIWDLE
ncbi:Protein NRDE2-like protein [Smittium mucronatum]|uniref:Protein NRDE2-like protein n=1 Tax=Smittium mucronatum TaxID=133383 RepID=A0A1R0H578_9FUNG|nr:Protein NRDE2-like protein [Smittium mucronatum]